MRNKLHQFGLLIVGVLIGVAVSLNFSAEAQKGATTAPLPIEELRAFTEVFGRVKSDYVEPVEDKKLITEAINGMLSGLDPHSAYLDQEAFRELQVGNIHRVMSHAALVSNLPTIVSSLTALVGSLALTCPRCGDGWITVREPEHGGTETAFFACTASCQPGSVLNHVQPIMTY